MARPKPHHSLFRGLFRHTVAVDLGTANTLIYTDDRGIVLNQPSVVCFQKHAEAGHRRVAAVGSEVLALRVKLLLRAGKLRLLGGQPLGALLERGQFARQLLPFGDQLLLERGELLFGYG